MSRGLRLFFTTCLFIGAHGTTTAQEVDLPDIVSTDRPSFDLRNSVNVSSRDPALVTDSVLGAVRDASLASPTYQTFLVADDLLRVGQLDPRAEFVLSAPTVEVNLGDRNRTMVLTEESYDRDFDAYHLTLMGADSDDRGYLTVSKSSSEIVGTFTIGGSEYRMISLNGQSQLLYPVETPFRGFRRASLPDMSNPSGRLEARHLQLGYLASIGGRNVITGRDGRLIRTLGVEVGEIEIARARRSGVAGGREQFDEEVLATELEEFFNDHRVMTLHDENVELDVTHIRTFAGGLDVHARQVINGIPVEVPLMLTLSSEGKVQGITGTLLKTSTATVNRGTWLSFEEALPLATSKATADYGSTGTATPYGPELLYMAGSSDDTLVPYWRFNLHFNPLAAADSTSETVFEARVNAVTGDAFVHPSGVE